MTLFRIGFVIIYLVFLVAYFFSETSGNFKRRAINKIIMASLFLVCGSIWFFMKGNTDWHFLALFGLFFAWLGDVLLLWSFSKGGVSFSIGNLFFIAYLALLLKEAGVAFSMIWWVVILFVALFGLVCVLIARKWIDFGKLTLPLIFYMATTAGHGTLGVGLAATVAGTSALLSGIGLALFMISDYFLMTYKFKYPKNWILRCNSGTYFIGMLLVALSFSF
jgi:hypothetical protein